MFFWNSLAFFHDPADVGNLISGSSAFSETSLNIWKFTVHVLLKPGLENFELTLLACEMSAIVQYLSILWHCLSLGLEWKLTFSSAEFSKIVGIFNAVLSQHHLLGFEIAQLGIPSPQLALFVVILPKAHMTSHSRMSGSRWVITPSWLSGSWRSFLYHSSVYSCHLY